MMCHLFYSTVRPIRYRTRHFFNNYTTNEDTATKFEADLPHCVRNMTTDTHYRHTLQTHTLKTHTTDTNYRHALQTRTIDTHYRHALQTHTTDTLQTHTTDSFLFISHTTNVLLLKFRCHIFIGIRIIKEMPGSVASGTPCMRQLTRLC